MELGTCSFSMEPLTWRLFPASAVSHSLAPQGDSRYIPELIFGTCTGSRGRVGMSWDLRAGKDKWHARKREERRVDTH